jgi:predicted alpha/beta-hydrolase family hydrolase
MSALAEVAREVRITAGNAALSGALTVPESANGVVLFAHGSGSSRFSPRNAYVARELQRARVGTLLFDLLTPDEERRDALTREHRFDIALLATRLVGATRWLDAEREFSHLPIGYFGASTGSAAALLAAAQLGMRIAAVVSRGGRPDLAGEAALTRVTAATLLIVGSHDDEVLELNRDAYAHLRATKQLAIVRGASHLFEEPGALEEVARLAARWFASHLGAGSP